jgi:tetratricopeptide (TPR) repeat protein
MLLPLMLRDTSRSSKIFLICQTIVTVALIVSRPCLSQQNGSEWEKLFDAKQYSKAETLCTSWTKLDDLHKRVEAEKCLANVALSKSQGVTVLGNDIGGGSLSDGYAPEAIDNALKHLNAGMRLDPQDVSIHLGRLHILETSGRFDQMLKALEESLTIYKTSDALHDFLQYAPELGEMGQAKVGVQFCEILDKHFPNNHEIIGNIGAFYGMLGEHDQALIYLRKAAELAPADSMDAWNLGWNLKGIGRNDEADKWFLKSFALKPNSEEMPDRRCLYAEFVETGLKDTARACKLERESCTREEQTACKLRKKLAQPSHTP